MKKLMFVLGMLVGFGMAIVIWIIKPDFTERVAKTDHGMAIDTHALQEMADGIYLILQVSEAYDTANGDPIYLVVASLGAEGVRNYRVRRDKVFGPTEIFPRKRNTGAIIALVKESSLYIARSKKPTTL